MHKPPQPRRSAFSLMEMMLALAIAMVLLLALYFTLNMQGTLIKEGRDVLAEGALARNILTAIANDITSQVAVADPRSLPDASAAAASATSGTTTPSAMTPSTTTTDSTPVLFNTAVQGDGTYLTLAVMRVQKPRMLTPGSIDPTSYVGADQRRISYWLVMDGSETAGLARCEFKPATSPDFDTYVLPTDLPEQNKYVIAKEVKTLKFEYYDGTGWQPEGSAWNGLTDVTGDGGMLGAPSAIRITSTLKRP